MAASHPWWRRVIVWVLGSLIAVVGGLWMFQRRLIYFPEGNIPSVASVLPGWSDVTLVTADGLELGAWYAEPPNDAAVVVVFNGNAGNRADRAPLGERLAAAGFGVLLTDYRGYGGNPGRPDEVGLAADARAAAVFVAERAPGHPLVLYGESLGAAVALELAVSSRPAALVLRSPFTSMADVAGVHYPFLPASLLLRDQYPSQDRIGRLAAPLLVVAGSGDSIVPVDQSRELYALAPRPKHLLVVEGADHNDFELLAGHELVDAVVEFVREEALRTG